MRKLVKPIFCFLFSFLLHFSASGQSADLKKLVRWMAGSYNSTAQHLEDTANYFDIRLKMIPVWKDRTDGYWLYVEQAVAGYQDKPYRQRVYHLQETAPGVFESDIFTLQDPLRFAGHPEYVEKLSPDSLTAKSGCAVRLTKNGSSFVGGTVGENCPSDRRGATYTTSEVTITRKLLVSWDRGYNDKKEQVWGAEKGGYRFVKE
ncbi:MAG: phycocyanobilin lyase CpcT [Bacteroidota bacterium]|jgi:CpeT protein